MSLDFVAKRYYNTKPHKSKERRRKHIAIKSSLNEIAFTASV